MKNTLSTLRFLCAALMIVAVAVVSGCGKSKGTLAGKVTYKDQPVTEGNLVFTTEDGSTEVGFAGLFDDGTYLAENLPAGKYKVHIVLNNSKGDPKAAMMGGPGGMSMKGKIPGNAAKEKGPPKDFAKPKGVDIPFEFPKPSTAIKIPPRYQAAGTTDLSVEIKDGKNTKDFPLQ